jgi:hypothetical protein
MELAMVRLAIEESKEGNLIPDLLLLLEFPRAPGCRLHRFVDAYSVYEDMILKLVESHLAELEKK